MKYEDMTPADRQRYGFVKLSDNDKRILAAMAEKARRDEWQRMYWPSNKPN